MAGFTDRVRERLREGFTDWTGLAVADAGELDTLRESVGQVQVLADEAEDLADRALDMVTGVPREVELTHRRIYARRSRTAFIHDPLAGAEANLRSNFAFGRGISKPEANEEAVQEIIDRAWNDPVNMRKLTSFAAQRKRSNDLLTEANLFPVYFERNGRIRIAFLNPAEVSDIVPDPEDDEVPLYYVSRRVTQEWDFDNDMPKPTLGVEMEGGREKVYYYAHWRFVEAAIQWATEQGGKKPPLPPPNKQAPGGVEHIAINQIGRTHFGIPPWTRSLRFYSAMNQLTEAQVAMRQGAASIIAQRTRRGGPKDIQKLAGNVLSMVGEIGASRFPRRGDPPTAGPGTEPKVGKAPPPAGSWLTTNEGERLEAVNLSSGASQAAQDAQIVRAPIAASSGFGQHYLGDASSTNLATATTLELPTLMEVSAWQEVFEGLYRWFIDRAIESAVRAGQLGGMVAEASTPTDTRPLNELRLPEDREEMERRTGIDLGYSFEMPYPGRRNLPDVTSSVTTIAAAFDPMGVNVEMRRKLLDFFARHGLQIDDPAAWVDEVLSEDPGEQVPGSVGWGLLNLTAPGGEEDEEEPPGGAVSPPAPDGRESTTRSQRGEKTRGGPPSREMGGGPKAKEMQRAVLREGVAIDPDAFAAALVADAASQFGGLLGDPAALLTGKAPDWTGKARNGDQTKPTPPGAASASPN